MESISVYDVRQLQLVCHAAPRALCAPTAGREPFSGQTTGVIMSGSGQLTYICGQSRARIAAALVWVVLLVSAGGQVATAQDGSLQYDGRERTYHVHLPPAYQANPDTTFSLILGFHGGVGSGTQFETQSQLSAKADSARHPFIAVYPDGVANLLGIRTWNAGNCCGFARDNAIDDVGFVSALIDRLLQDYRIDPDRVYATGISNGGMLSFRLATLLPDRIAAAAPVAGSLVHGLPLMHGNPAPIIQFHSFLDDNVPLEGGVGNGLSDHYNPPADSALTAWAQQNGCAGDAQVLLDSPDAFLLRAWSPCGPRTEVVQWISYDGGHSWPGGQKTVIGDPASEALDANGLMWTFFLENPLNAGSTSVGEFERAAAATSEIVAYPNPAALRVRFDTGPDTGRGYRHARQMVIFDVLGRVRATLRADERFVTWEFGASGSSAPSPGAVCYRPLRGRGSGWKRHLHGCALTKGDCSRARSASAAMYPNAGQNPVSSTRSNSAAAASVSPCTR